MRILLTDDEPLALEDSFDALRIAIPDADVVPCDNYADALNEAEEPFDIAFLDVEMPGMLGIDLARELQKKYPKINIVFVTAFKQYALDAYGVNASSYVLKPISPDDILSIMENLRYDMNIPRIINKASENISATCFGEFTIFDKQNRPVIMRREKAKELFAYLISKNGVEATPTELCDALWGEDSDMKLDYFWKLTSELRKTLKDADAEDVLIQARGKYAIDKEKIDCDFLQYLAKTYRDKWNGQFCEQYGGWAEVTKAALMNGKI